MNIPNVGFVINYFWCPGFPSYVRHSAFFALQMVRNSLLVNNIVLVDGSPIPDTIIESYCIENGIEYLHAGRALSFAEGYNIGWKSLDNPFIGLMASDIFPFPETINTLLNMLSVSDVGVVSPYLDFCDYPGQIGSFVRKPTSCEPTSISLNLNIFRRDVLEMIEGIDEKYTGGYNDLVMLKKVREKGFRVVLVGGTRVSHMGRVTVAHGTKFMKRDDDIQFTKEYPEFRAAHGKWYIKHWRQPFATTMLATFFWWTAQNFPTKRGRQFLQWLTIWLEPDLTRYPARYGKLGR